MPSIQGEPDDDEFLDSLHGIAPEDLRRYRGRPLTARDREYLQARSDTHPTSPVQQARRSRFPSGERKYVPPESEIEAPSEQSSQSVAGSISTGRDVKGSAESASPPAESPEASSRVLNVETGRFQVTTGSQPAMEAEPTTDHDPDDQLPYMLYNERDLSAVESIAKSLERLGIRTSFFLPDFSPSSGRANFERQRYQTACCVVVFLGDHGWGPIQEPIAEEVSALERPIILVLTGEPPSDAIDPDRVPPRIRSILRMRQYFDLSSPTPERTRELADAIRRFLPAGVAILGGRLSVQRMATAGQIGLKADAYARVLADVLRDVAQDEPLCLGLFGAWGRGKTFLMDLAAKDLGNQQFAVVPFSAWKYRTTPELWIHLYEQLAQRARKDSWLMPLRVGVERRGLWPAVAIIVSLAISLMPLMEKAVWTQWVLASLGVAGTAFLTGALFQLRKAGLALKSSYWTLPRHQERLGLQFAVGDDLRALLCSWLPHQQQAQVALREFVTRHALSLIGYCAALLGLWYVLQDVAISLAGANQWSAWLVLAIGSTWIAAGLALLAYLLRVKTGDRRKVVLVVDDLDRCHPDQMLEVIECLQLFLDDSEIQTRLRIVMLVEEEILQNAIQRKYDKLRAAEASDALSDRKLIRDNLEKLFLLWLRLPPLGPEEVSEILDKLTASLVAPEFAVGAAEERGEVVSAQESSVVRRGVTLRWLSRMYQRVSRIWGARTSASTANVAQQAGEKERTPVRVRKAETTLSNDERRFLAAAAENLAAGDLAHYWGPRSLRSFVFKYQLARMLLNETGHDDFDSQLLIQAMTRQLRGDPAGSDPAVPPVLVEVARQVC